MLPMDAVGVRKIITAENLKRLRNDEDMKPGEKVRKVIELCKIFRTSRKTIWKWTKRLEREGEEGLKDRSRAPKRVHNRTSRVIEKIIVFLYEKFRMKGIDIWLLIRKFYSICRATVYNVLKKRVTREEKKKGCKRFERSEPNHLWQIDITRFRIKGTGKIYIIAIDDFSRFLVHIEAFTRQTARNVVRCLRQAMEKHGRPKQILSDNGKMFLAKKVKKLLAKEGIKHIRSSPYHPQTQGKIERFFRALKEELLRVEWFRGIEELANRLKVFQKRYNFHRRHTAINYSMPSERYLG